MRKTGKQSRNRIRRCGTGILLALVTAAMLHAAVHAAETEAETTQEQTPEQIKETAVSDSIPRTEEPEGYYTVILRDIRADIPEGGRVYDGTDRIELAFEQEIETDGEQEEIPEYTVSYEAHLDGCETGERRVLYSFSLQTPYPDHIKLKEDQEYPDLTVEVRKAVLSLRIADGTKKYMEPADMDHITFDSVPAVTVSGFVKDEEGREVIPPGFRIPEITVDSTVLKADSPMREPAERDPDQEEDGEEKMVECRYEAAIVPKRTPDGKITGDPTGNYEFCEDPEDERFHTGTVTVTSGQIRYGTDYLIEGDEGAWLPAGEDEVIVREGSRLYAEPLKESGYNTGAASGALSGSGVFTFRLKKQNHSGQVTADSEEAKIRYVCDSYVPEASLTVSGAAGSGALLYSASSASVTVAVPPDDRSGIRSVRFRILNGRLSAENLSAAASSEMPAFLSAGEWKASGTSGNITLQEEGIFRIECETEDRTGNRSLVRSPFIVIDHTGPSVTIQGVSDGSANAGAVILSASCSDAAYRPGSMSTSLTAALGGMIPERTVLREGADGTAVRFADFPHTRKADAFYTFRVRAEDLAGNETVRTVSFSVNRFGSSYRLGKQTEERIRSYYHRQPFPVTFIETNLDQVPQARIFLRGENSLRELTPGDGTLSRKEEKREGLNRYTYTVSADAFREDGRYEVSLFSIDAAGNASDSAAQELPVRFVIDRTAPQCLITGIRDGGEYRAEKITAVAGAEDNIALAEMHVFRDAVLQQTLGEEELSRTGGVIKLTFEKKEEYQTLQIRVTDRAGNEYWTQEMSFLVSEKAGTGGMRKGRKRLSAEQLARIAEWFSLLRERIFRSAAGNSAEDPAQKIRMLLSKDNAAADPAGSVNVREAQISAQELQNRRLMKLLAAAGMILIIPLLYLASRSRPDRNRR